MIYFRIEYGFLKVLENLLGHKFKPKNGLKFFRQYLTLIFSIKTINVKTPKLI